MIKFGITERGAVIMTRLDEVAKIFERLSEQDLEYLGTDHVKTNYRRLFTAQRNNKIAGYLAIYPDILGYYIVLAVDPNYRHQGIATTLVEKAVTYFYQRSDMNDLLWASSINNNISIKLAHKFGFIYRYKLTGQINLYSIRKEEI